MLFLKKIGSGILKHALLIIMVILAVFPLYWMILTSFRNPGELYSFIPYTITPTTSNYISAFISMPLWRMMGNSLVIGVLETLLQLVTAVLAAYALTRWDFKGKTIIYGLIMFTWLIPFQAIVVPNYIQINNWGINGTLLAIILPNMASSFAIVSLFSTFNSFPRALLDSSRMDGSSELQTLMNIVLPNMKASIASLAILIFINTWNDYLWPTRIIQKVENSPIQVGLKSFVSLESGMWGPLMAATTVSCIPILLLYIVMQKNIVKSFMKWGIK